MNDLMNQAAERGVLSCILKGGSDAFSNVDELLRPEFFFLEPSQVVYKCIKYIYDKDPSSKIDLTTIVSASHDIGLAHFFSEKSNQQFLRSLSSLDISQENITKEAQKVARLAVTRLLIEKLDESKKELYKVKGSETLSHILSIPEVKIAELSSLVDKDESKTTKMGDGAQEWLQNVLNNPNKCVGIPTGFSIFDRALGGGLRNGTVNLIAARLKTGKSFFVDNVGMHVSKGLNIPVLNLDTEMSKEEHLARICSFLTKIDLTDIEEGKINTVQAKQLKEAIKIIESIPYHYRCVAGYPFEDILSVIRRWITKEVGIGNKCLIIYDYFKVMDIEKLEKMAEFQALGFQLSTLTNFALKYKVPVLSFAQTNRDGASEETVETIAASDRLGWFASSVSIFKKKTPEEIAQDKPENGNRKLIPLACRHGKGMENGDWINMNFRGDLGRITEINTRSQVFQDRKKKENENKEEVAF